MTWKRHLHGRRFDVLTGSDMAADGHDDWAIPTKL